MVSRVLSIISIVSCHEISVVRRLTFLVSVLVAVGVTVGRPMRAGQYGDAMITSEWSSADVADVPETRRPDGSSSRAGARAHGVHRRFAVKREEVDNRWSGMISSHDTALTGAPFFDDYASLNSCTFCNNDFADLTWKKLLMIFVITLTILIAVVVLFWILCHCCMCHHDPNCSCQESEPKKGSQESICDDKSCDELIANDHQ